MNFDLSAVERAYKKAPRFLDQTVPAKPSKPFDADNNALSIPRTTAEVLNIEYHGGHCSGGFFPEGMNGTIVCRF